MKTQKGSIIHPCFDGVPNATPPRKARVAMMPWKVTEISPNGDARAHPLGSDSSEAMFFKSWVLKTP